MTISLDGQVAIVTGAGQQAAAKQGIKLSL